MINFKNIKMVCVDVDGVLTDGIYQVSDDGHIVKNFYTRDFSGIENLMLNGISVMIITSSFDKVIDRRIELIVENSELWQKWFGNSVINIFKGVNDKASFIKTSFAFNNLSWKNIAYIGDAEGDLDAMKKSAFSACPFDAIEEVKEQSNYVSDYNGGMGAVYDICKYIIGKRKTVGRSEKI